MLENKILEIRRESKKRQVSNIVEHVTYFLILVFIMGLFALMILAL